MTQHPPVPARPSSRTAGIAVAFAAVAAVLFVIAPPARACSCVAPPPVATVLDEAPLAFIGTQVARVESEQTMGAVLTISVSEVYTGEATTLVDLRTGSGDADCGIDLQGAGPVGFTPSPADGGLYVGLCGGTVPADEMRQIFAERGVAASGPVSAPDVTAPPPASTAPPDTSAVPDTPAPTAIDPPDAAADDTTPAPTGASSLIWLLAVAAAAGVAGAGFLMARRRR